MNFDMDKLEGDPPLMVRVFLWRFLRMKMQSKSIQMTLLLGKRSVPPKLTSHSAAIPYFLGRSHAPNTYTPPWMRRLSSQKRLLPLSDPPDA
ncbi:unnamed protein product [Microthlaspi erraticum]|uniref:Uncharacterized protein n=1 Tax=Microthlaspi erraticum TaxID=1685480 RepID=A0A6D2LIR2_9BRAS|nr:unnamed protein product [Microthlaspi erraticum]CAA7061190.1 unnamed protein product [Microthlaspi erraticum]